jgi:hypothetical protein
VISWKDRGGRSVVRDRIKVIPVLGSFRYFRNRSLKYCLMAPVIISECGF